MSVSATQVPAVVRAFRKTGLKDLRAMVSHLKTQHDGATSFQFGDASANCAPHLPGVERAASPAGART